MRAMGALEAMAAVRAMAAVAAMGAMEEIGVMRPMAMRPPSRPPRDLRYETLSTPTRPETRNSESMYKNKVETTRVQTRDPRATVLFVYANN